jgi:hypothetical protein
MEREDGGEGAEGAGGGEELVCGCAVESDAEVGALERHELEEGAVERGICMT